MHKAHKRSDRFQYHIPPHQHQTIMPPSLVTLNVSGRIYKTRPSTLSTSPYFTALLARWDSGADLQDDGSYFIDADADTFEHILTFMRRPSKFPLYWTHEHGFDYALYNKIETEADFFLLHGLRDWVRAKRYMDAVKTVVEVRVLAEGHVVAFNETGATGMGDHVEVNSFLGSYSGERRVHLACSGHRGSLRDSCWSCQKLAGATQFDEPEKKLTLVIKKVVFNEAVCCNDGASD
jgi:hypothetical protein